MILSKTTDLIGSARVPAVMKGFKPIRTRGAIMERRRSLTKLQAQTWGRLRIE
jgi:hypothetical protein